MLAFFTRTTDAAETVSDIIASKITPAALEFLDRTTIACVEDYAHLGLPSTAEALLLIEVDGTQRWSRVMHRSSNGSRKHGATDVKVAADAARPHAEKRAQSGILCARPRQAHDNSRGRDCSPERSRTMLERINAIAASYNLTLGILGTPATATCIRRVLPTNATRPRSTMPKRRSKRSSKPRSHLAARSRGTRRRPRKEGFSRKDSGPPASR